VNVIENAPLSWRKAMAQQPDNPSDKPIGEFIGPVPAPSSSRYCRVTYTAPQSPPSAGGRIPSVNRLDRPDASITKPAVSVRPSTVTPTVRPRWCSIRST
jgi:hypothetical protein